MKVSHYIGAFCVPVAIASAIEKSAEPELPNLQEIFIAECADVLFDKCPEAAKAAEPFIDGSKTDFDFDTILDIAIQVQGNQGCVDVLPHCAGKVVEVSLGKLIGASAPAV